MKCSACKSANVAESGKIALAVLGQEDWHAYCEGPGSGCDCGCDYSLGRQCPECGIAGGLCEDKNACAARILASLQPGPNPPAPQARADSHVRADVLAEAAERAAGRITGRSAFDSPSRPSSGGRKRPCTCECGEMTGGGLFRPGHDARLVSRLVGGIRAGTTSLEDAQAKLPSDALKAKLTKAVT